METNELCGIACLVFAGIFILMGILFAVLKEKGAMLISGFNTMPKEERELYDRKSMSRDMRNSLLLWAGVLGAGGILALFFGWFWAAGAGAVWLVLFFREVHLDARKAFEKYRNNKERES